MRLASALLLTATLASSSSLPSTASTDALTGRWMLVQVTESIADLPVVGDARNTATATMLFDLDVTGDRLHGPGELCALTLAAKPDLLRPVLPPSYVAAIPKQQFDGRLHFDDDGVLLETPRAYVVMGAKLARPLQDPLPKSADDPLVDDTDRDGKPGVTMLVEGLASAEVYMTSRRYDQMEGRLAAPDRFEGSVRHDQEQELLGSSNALLRVLPPMRPDLARSRFVMKRVDAGTRCADVAGPRGVQ